MKSEINKRVAFYRKKAGLKQSEIAVLMGMKSSSYSQMERQGDISANRIIALANILKIDVKVLLYGEETSPKEPLDEPDKEVVTLPKPPYGMKYIAVNNIVNSIVKTYTYYPKNYQQIICDVFNFLSHHKKITIQQDENHIEIF